MRALGGEGRSARQIGLFCHRGSLVLVAAARLWLSAGGRLAAAAFAVMAAGQL
jgi:hypothetical protein